MHPKIDAEIDAEIDGTMLGFGAAKPSQVLCLKAFKRDEPFSNKLEKLSKTDPKMAPK